MAVMNGDGTVYRRIIADGQQESVLLLRCFEAHSFEMHLHGGEIVASLDGGKTPD